MTLRCWLAGLALAVFASPSAWAGAPTSVYTKFDSHHCRHEKGTDDEDYGRWICRGLKGFDIILAAGDQRMSVTYGAANKRNGASAQTFPAFNNAYQGTVEWRLDAGRPYATILRWSVMKGSDVQAGRATATGRVLVVTRLGPDGSCHVGYVDAQLNPNANELARQIADEVAPGFRCGTDKRVIRGKTTPDLAMPKDGA